MLGYAAGYAGYALAGSWRVWRFQHQRVVSADHFQAISTVGRLQKENVFADHPQEPPYWSGDILVQAIWELDHNDRAVARNPHQTPGNHPLPPAPELAQYNVHAMQISTAWLSGKGQP